MRSGLLIVALLAAGSLVATPALAKHKGGKPAVSCKEIKDAIASGKTEDDVVKDLKTTSSHVKSCTAPPKKHAEKKG